MSFLKSREASAVESATGAEAVDISSTNHTPAKVGRALYVGSSGDVKVDIGSSTVTFSSVPAGAVLDIAVSKIYKTGTTAGSMVVMY